MGCISVQQYRVGPMPLLQHSVTDILNNTTALHAAIHGNRSLSPARVDTLLTQVIYSRLWCNMHLSWYISRTGYIEVRGSNAALFPHPPLCASIVKAKVAPSGAGRLKKREGHDDELYIFITP